MPSITGQKGYENFWMRRTESNGVLINLQKSCTEIMQKMRGSRGLVNP